MKKLRAILICWLHGLLLLGASDGLSGESDFIQAESIEYFRELASSHPLNVEAALAAQNWQKITIRQLNFGLSKDIHWIRFRLTHSHPRLEKLIVDLGNSNIGDILVHVYASHASSQVPERSYSMGSLQPYSNRPIDSTSFAVPIPLHAGETKTVVLRVSGPEPLALLLDVDAEPNFFRKLMISNSIIGLLIGGLVAMCIYNFFLYFSTNDRVYLYYSLFIICTTILNAILKGWVLKFLVPDYPIVVKYIDVVVINGAIIAGAAFSILFLDLPNLTPRFYRFTQFMMVMHILPVLSLAFLPLHKALQFTIYIVTVGAGLPIMAGLLVFRKSRLAKFYLLSMSIAGLGGSLLLLTYKGLVPLNGFTWNSLLIGSFVEAMLLSFSLGDRLNQLKIALAQSNDELAFLNKNLERTVVDKTQDIRAILDSIPQGVFAIESGLMIRGEVSARLPEIIDSESIVDQSVQKTFIERMKLSADEKDRIVQTLECSIGEDVLAFQINSCNLPKEVQFRSFKNIEKILSLTWDPIVDDEQIVQRLLVTVMDITATKKLEDELHQQQDDLKIIKQLLDCGEKKFSQFSATIEPLLEENLRLIEAAHGGEDLSIIKILFINVHTAKGGARTLGLLKLAEVLHEAEQYYSALYKKQQAFSHDRLKADSLKIAAVYNEYEKINRIELGRKNKSKTVSVSRDFLSSQFEMLHKLNKISPFTEQMSIKEDLSGAIDHLSKLIFRELTHVLGECFGLSTKIARDLEKPSPHVLIEESNFHISFEIEDLLHKVVVHIIRNIMDHGIEGPQERMFRGKSAIGSIDIRIRRGQDGLVELSICDDGRGLAVNNIRAQAVQNCGLSEDASLEDIVEAVFIPGLSTATAMSHVSGRGMGMDAVRRFMQQAGGKIWLELAEPLDAEGEFYRFRTVLEIPVIQASFDLG